MNLGEQTLKQLYQCWDIFFEFVLYSGPAKCFQGYWFTPQHRIVIQGTNHINFIPNLAYKFLKQARGRQVNVDDAAL